MQYKILNRTIFHIFLTGILCFLAYSNTFESSFQFDDEAYLVKNPGIRDLRNFSQFLSSEDIHIPFESTFKRRYTGFLTFAINYRLDGLNVAGYHYVNLFIHICSSLLVYFFIIFTFQTPYLRDSAIRQYERHIALFAALLFACHPLQTQAVTYIWQRITSLCAMFYLLSLVTYIKWRHTDQLTVDRSQMTGNRKQGGRWLLYALSIISAVLAMKTKEIAFMLPVMLIVYEVIFLTGKMKKRILYLIPFLLTMLIIPLSLINIDQPIGEMVKEAGLLRGSTELSREEYLLAQFRVLVTYLRLIFLPVNQNLDYDYPKYYSFLNIEIFSSFAFLLSIFGLSIYILYRYRDSVPHTRLIFFGIIWFFVNLLLESSVIPLDNVIFEHRMYLPSAGVFTALTVAIFMAVARWKAYAKVITAMFAIIIIALTGATYARNSVWKDELTLWQDVVKKSPDKVRGYLNLGRGYSLQGFLDEAIKQFRLVLEFDPNYSKAYYDLGHILQMQGFTDSAIRHYQKAVQIDPTYSEAHYKLAKIYRMRGLADIAMRHYEKAVHFNPTYAEAYNNLGNIYASQGFIDKAIKQYLTAIRINRYYHDARYNLGNTYASQGLIDMAIEQYLLAIQLMPDQPMSHHNLGVAYKYKGLPDKAIEHYLLAIQLKPDYPEAHHSLGLAYKSQGKTDLAIRAFNNALRIRPDWELPLAELEQINKER